MTRWPRPRRRWRDAQPSSNRDLCTPTKTWRSAFSGPGSCAWTGCAAACSTRRRASKVRRAAGLDPRLARARRRLRRRLSRRAPLGQQSAVGAARLITVIWRRSRTGIGSGVSRCGAPGAGEPACGNIARRRFSIGGSRRCARTSPSTEQLEDLRWQGARREELTALCREIADEGFLERMIRFTSVPGPS